MALFRRRSRDDSAADSNEPAEDAGIDLDETGLAADADAAVGGPAAYDRSRGPWDAAEVDVSAEAGVERFDLGALRVPVLPGLSLQLEVDQDQNVTAVTALREDGGVNLQALAAPKSGGLWAEFREELAAELDGAGHKVIEHDGPFGPELRVVLPEQAPDGTAMIRPLRFVGIDGPRWFLKVTFGGRPAIEPDYDDELHHVVRETVVVRGSEAMAPRDLLPMKLPDSVQAQQQLQEVDEDGLDDSVEDFDDADFDDADDESTYDGRLDLNPFERGPEITEIR